MVVARKEDAMSRNRGIPIHVLAVVLAGALLVRAATAQPAAQHTTITGTIWRVDARTGAFDLLTGVGHVVRVTRVVYAAGVQVTAKGKEVGMSALVPGAVCHVDCEGSPSGPAATRVELILPAPARAH